MDPVSYLKNYVFKFFWSESSKIKSGSNLTTDIRDVSTVESSIKKYLLSSVFTRTEACASTSPTHFYTEDLIPCFT